jgi:formylglycine-generating enzyme required for sulfatase activity
MRKEVEDRNESKGESKMKTGKWIVVGVAGIVLAGTTRAGSLDPTNAPGPTMHTLEEIYQGLLTTQAQVASNQQAVADMQARMVAAGMQQTSGDMVLIPAGSFVMGACTNVGQESIADAVPQHTVHISPFYMEKHEVTSNLWREVYTWATNKGYAFGNVGSGRDSTHPVQTVNWHDCVAWCNARSQRDGFTPCYTNANGSYYTNSAIPLAGDCNWSANGYRLPTEAEWEKATRGGVANRRYPWDDANTIQHARANYYAVPADSTYDTSPTTGYHPDTVAPNPRTLPVGSFAPNGYDICDVAGNVYEWCWDWYSSTYYTNSPPENPTGPASGATRVLRGGSWGIQAPWSRCASRDNDDPTSEFTGVGFRCARGL